ncbi:MAG: methyltransferase domain-containing protein [Gammaproteobacteria bacterium]|nr:methyltransferase domain-containing protein [Gammaproteobacteria bacterium]NNC56675.1 methyltransferase domain-containing protein [Woeseiaceae bacterium]
MLDAHIEKGSVAGVYGKIAHAYDLWAWLTESKARDRCLELAGIKDGENVLEVAVGTGLAFEKILQENPSGENEGIDLTEAMLIRAEQKAAKSGSTNYRLRVGDAYELDFLDNTFDVLINNYMFDLLPQRDFLTVLTEFKRVLRPGGRLAMVNMTKGEHWYNGLWERIYRINPALLGGCRAVSLIPFVEECGFIQTRREYLSQLTFPSEIICARTGGST